MPTKPGMMESSSRLNEVGEYALHALVESLLNSDGDRQVGDDCAILHLPGFSQSLLVNVDRLSLDVDLDVAAELLVAQTLSDVIVTGGEPVAVLVSIQLPPDFLTTDFVDLMERLNTEAQRYGARLVGGDTKEGETFMMVGVGIGVAAPDVVVRRVEVKPGDALLATCAHGALWGRRWASHLSNVMDIAFDGKARHEPELRLPHQETASIVGTGAVRAGLDLSDGLGGALQILGRHNNVGFELFEQALDRLVAPELGVISLDLGLKRAALALSPGYQWENLLVVDPDRVSDCESAASSVGGLAIHVGNASTGRGVDLVRVDGTRSHLEVVPDEKFQKIPWIDRTGRWLTVMRSGPLGR